MLSKLKTTSPLVISLLAAAAAVPSTVAAQITNPAISQELGGNAQAAADGSIFARYFVTLWQGIITVGGLMLLIYFLWAGIEWITAGGDAGKVTKARDRLTQSVVGFIILVSTVTILAFLGRVFFGDSIDLFNLRIPTPTN